MGSLVNPLRIIRKADIRPLCADFSGGIFEKIPPPKSASLISVAPRISCKSLEQP